MISALSGFGLIGAIVLAGWMVRRWAGLPAGAEEVLGRFVFAVLAPCLLFTGAAAADLRLLVSEPLLVSAAAALVCFGLHALTTRGRPGGVRVVGALTAGYTNATYIGIPVATYVLGDASLVVPIVLLQLLVITPVALTLLQLAGTGRVSLRAAAGAPLRNPVTVAVVLGVLVAATGRVLPGWLAAPVATIGEATVPVVLIAFGMALSGRRVLAPGPDRLPTAAAVAAKTVLMPATAFGLATLLRLDPATTYAVTVLAALPTAQNIFLYAQQYGAGLVLARDAIFLSTVACVPVLLLVAVLLSGR